MSAIHVSHIGICVRDLEHSTHFYCEALGFREAARHDVGDEFATLMELDTPLRLRTVMLEKDGVVIELLAYQSPETKGPATRRPMNQLGFTHLSLRVDDVDKVADAIVAHGGQALHDKDFRHEQVGDFLYCTDPDGTRIELMRLKGQ